MVPPLKKISQLKIVVMVLLAAFCPQSILAQGLLNQSKDLDKKEPIEITSDRMRSENQGLKIVFSGNVVGIWGDLKILSDILEIHNTPDKKGTEQIIALGNVVITRGEKKATGDKAIYLDKKQKIILTGSPIATAWEGKNKIESKEMIFLLDSDRFLAKDKVRMKFYPKEQQGKSDKK